jgi:hypothetical protein
MVALAATGWIGITLVLIRVTKVAAAQVTGPGPARTEDAVTLLAGVGGLLAAGWLALAALVAILAAVSPRSWVGAAAARAGVRIAPAGLRRAVVLAIGVGLVGATPAVAAPVRSVGGVGLPAAVVPGPAPGTGTAATVEPRAVAPDVRVRSVISSGAQVVGPPPEPSAGEPTISGHLAAEAPAEGLLDPAWAATGPTGEGFTEAPPVAAEGGSRVGTASGGPALPGQRVATQARPPGASVRPRPRAGDAVVVRRGDCLWAIAARTLGSATADADIAAEWPRWYAANRATIGDRPDLLQPGQRLYPPGERPDGPPGDGGPTNGTPAGDDRAGGPR